METQMRLLLCRALCLGLALATSCGSPSYDLVIHGGRSIDPESGLDGVRDIGIRGDRVARISERTLEGARVLDATGLVVAPGFIDLHQHQHDTTAYRLKALDGVTTALELETGVPDYARFVEARRGKALINYGGTVSHEGARVVAWGGYPAPSQLGPATMDDPPSGPVTDDPATPEQLDRLLGYLRQQLDAGALGIGIGLEYTPGASRLEVIRIFELAAERRLPVYVHVRSAARTDPGSSVESVSEIIAASAVSGAPAHIVHLNSSCLSLARQCLAMVEGARARGLAITTEGYPYGAGMPSIASAIFNPGWRERRGLDYSDIELPETGERLTKARFDALHAAAKPIYVLLHMNPDSIVDLVIESPLTLVASDGLPNHPRNTGTFARILSHYVRSRRSITLVEAIRKMSLMPAQVLAASTPAARRKGRLQEGADADIVVFDPAQVSDRSTYQAPWEASVGMRYVLVAGTPVVEDGRVVPGAAPGRPLTATRALTQ